MPQNILPRHFALGLLSCLLALCLWQANVRRPSFLWARLTSKGNSLPQPQPYGPYSDYCPLAKYEHASGCEVTQINIIQRHGARYPTSGATVKTKEAINKLRKVNEKDLDPSLSFLKDYEYSLGEDDLLPWGKQQAYDAGREVVDRYPELFEHQNPFVRASSSLRVVESSEHWIKGFQDVTGRVLDDPLILYDEPHSNDTLSNHACANYDFEPLHEALKTWARHSGAEAAERLERRAPGSQVTPFDFVALASMCPMEKVAFQGKSPWCGVFDDADWTAFEGFFDVQKYFYTGPGHPLGPVQGVGYITEVLSRLTGKLVPDDTQTNHTLNKSPSTFPLDRSAYVDFSHDNQQIAIFAAMGLLRSVSMDPSRPPTDPHKWLASCMVPFASRMVIERLMCGKETWVRVLVNERVHRMQRIDDFVASQSYALREGQEQWLQCKHQSRDIWAHSEQIVL